MRSICLLLLVAAACGHAPAAPSRAGGWALPDGGVDPEAPAPDQAAAQLSLEAHALFKSEGELFWQRWTTGAGSMPASALAAHPALLKRQSLDLLMLAAAKHPDSKSLPLLRQQLATLQISREAGAEIDALERARAQLGFSVEGQERSERELDRLLTDEPSAQKRAGLVGEQAIELALRPLLSLDGKPELRDRKSVV